MIKLGTLFWLLLVSATGFAMFAVKYEVQALEDELARTKRATIAEEHEIRVLDAEWAYLTRPETLEEMNRHHLSLAPIATKQLHAILPDIPLRPPAPIPVEPPEPVVVAEAPPADSGPPVLPEAPEKPAAAPESRPAIAPTALEKPVRAVEIAKTVPAKAIAKPAVPRRPKTLDELIAQIAASR